MGLKVETADNARDFYMQLVARLPRHFFGSEPIDKSRKPVEVNYHQLIRPEEARAMINLYHTALHVHTPDKGAFDMKQLNSVRILNPDYIKFVDLLHGIREGMRGEEKKLYNRKTLLQRRIQPYGLSIPAHRWRQPAGAKMFWIVFINQGLDGEWILPDCGMAGTPNEGYFLRFPSFLKFGIAPLHQHSTIVYTLEGWLTDLSALEESID